jgi:hypothetical protein
MQIGCAVKYQAYLCYATLFCVQIYISDVQIDVRFHDRFLFTLHTWAAKSAHPICTSKLQPKNAGLGGPVKFINSEEPMALMALEQERLKERRLKMIVGGVEEHPNPEEAGFIKKAFDIEQATIIANIRAPRYSIN